MRISIFALAVCIFLGLAVAQGPPPKTLPPSILPASHAEPSLAEQRTLMARRALEWLYRSNQLSGRFVAGIQPVGGAIVEANGMIEQAQCAAALAAGARHFNDERLAVRARQAVLALLTETKLDPNDSNVRVPDGTSPLGGAAMLLWAIHELPQPAADMLDQGEQLANYICRHQQPNGMLVKDVTPVSLTDQGMALFALMKSQTNRASSRKTEVARMAMAGVQTAWASNPHAGWAAWHARAYAEAYLQSADRARDIGYGQLSLMLCDQLAGRLEVKRSDAIWQLLAIQDQLRVCRQTADLERNKHFQTACDRGWAMIDALQFTNANCQHLPPERRPNVIGALRTSADDATIRSENTAAAVFSLIGG